jgi:hypothetical protein
MVRFTILFNISLFITVQISVAESDYTQTIRGRVLDKDSHMPLIGATIVLLDSTLSKGTITDVEGYYKLENVPVGRCGVSISYIGYKPETYNNLILRSGKELILDVMLEENIQWMDEVVIKAFAGKEDPLNDMAAISARSFTVEETEKYAGSWGDPARMAANYAGVFTAGDQRNDIIIRGNSPIGLIWRLEGIPVPNPNHFDILGATGGPVSILNNNLLARSDFFTSAFPAEYGNGISGVFDLNMRNGNNQKREYLAQLSFGGFELGAEGPFSKNSNASYLVNYRYSMLGLLDELLWIEALPHYQDLSFKLNFPTKSGRVSVFGLGGISYIDFIEEDTLNSTTEITREFKGRSSSATGIIGLNHVYFFGEKTRIINSIAYTTRRPGMDVDSLENDEVSLQMGKYESAQNKYLLSSKLISKFNTKNTAIFGLLFQNYSLNQNMDDYDIDQIKNEENITIGESITLYDPYEINIDNMILLQAYVNWQHRFTNNLTANIGLHYENFAYNNTTSIEPRLSMKWQISKEHSVSTGYGLHSQLQPLFYYYNVTRTDSAGRDIYTETKRNLDFTKSHQLVAGYDWTIATNLRFKAEAYYQHLFNIPVDKQDTYFSMVNVGAGFYFPDMDSLVNKGTGENYGVEFTLEKFLSKNYYFLVTTSLFNSTYKQIDGVKRNTAYNGKFIVNALAGYEVPLKKNRSLDFNLKVVWAGGRRIIPVDPKITDNDERRDYSRAYEEQVPDYFRIDGRISIIRHKKRSTHEFAIDLTNITNRSNEYDRFYNSTTNEVEIQNQQKFFPMGLYRINF